MVRIRLEMKYGSDASRPSSDCCQGMPTASSGWHARRTCCRELRVMEGWLGAINTKPRRKYYEDLWSRRNER
jgi:hypothetical protein